MNTRQTRRTPPPTAYLRRVVALAEAVWTGDISEVSIHATATGVSIDTTQRERFAPDTRLSVVPGTRMVQADK
jgi:hypothetical protein